MRGDDIYVWTRTTDIPYFNERERVEIGNICIECPNKMFSPRMREPFSQTYVIFEEMCRLQYYVAWTEHCPADLQPC